MNLFKLFSGQSKRYKITIKKGKFVAFDSFRFLEAELLF